MWNIGSNWLKKYPFKSRTLLFGVFFVLGVAMLPSDQMAHVNRGFMYYLQSFLSQGFAASAGVQISFIIRGLHQEWKDKSDAKRMKNINR